jgi:murein DD-endopeptidase MepM/ murein hydrolase activator NlpD
MRQFGRGAGRLAGGVLFGVVGVSLLAVAVFQRTIERTEGEIASLRREAVRTSQAEAERSARDRALLDRLGHELAQSSAERGRAVAAFEAQARIVAGRQVRIDQLSAERDSAIELASERGRLLAARDSVLAEIASEGIRLARERDQAVVGRDRAMAERDQAAIERDQAMAERDAMMIEARQALHALDGETRTVVADVEKIIAAAGLEPSRLVPEPNRIRRVGARGGPYIPWKAQVALAEHAGNPQLHTLSLQLDRLKSLHDVMVRLPLVAPVTHAILSDGFGYRRDPVNGGGARHDGLDLRAVRDSAVIAPAAGTVIAAGWDGAFGNLIQIDHGFGVVSRYAHLSRMLVRKGDVVAPNEKIGVVGATGRVTGTHLHYEIWIDGQPRDPMRFLSAVSRAFAGFGRQ